jgi:hypothetical protein
MAKLTNKQKAANAKYDSEKEYSLQEAANIVKDITFTKFDSSVDLDIRLGVDPRKADQMVRGVAHLDLIPRNIADKALHPTDGTPLDLQGHRFDGFAFQGTELAHHIVEKLVPRFLADKTRPKGGVEPTEFIHKRVNIAACERKLGNGKRLVCRPTCR